MTDAADDLVGVKRACLGDQIIPPIVLWMCRIRANLYRGNFRNYDVTVCLCS